MSLLNSWNCSHRDVLDNLRDGILNDDITGTLEKVAAELVLKYKPQ